MWVRRGGDRGAVEMAAAFAVPSSGAACVAAPPAASRTGAVRVAAPFAAQESVQAASGRQFQWVFDDGR